MKSLVEAVLEARGSSREREESARRFPEREYHRTPGEKVASRLCPCGKRQAASWPPGNALCLWCYRAALSRRTLRPLMS